MANLLIRGTHKAAICMPRSSRSQGWQLVTPAYTGLAHFDAHFSSFMQARAGAHFFVTRVKQFGALLDV